MQVRKLTEEQREAVACNGNSVIVAGPGSGKTTVLSHKIAKVLADLPHYKGVVAISYTNKASNELRDRVQLLSRDTKASFFGTLDRFYIREIVLPFTHYLLGLPPISSPKFTTEVTMDWESVTQDLNLVVAELHQKRSLPPQALSKAALRSLSNIAPMFEQGQVHLNTVGSMAFLTVMGSYACRRYLTARYNCLFIDEYQDSGFEQHALFMLLSRLGLVSTAVGDLNQSIFGFARKDARYLEELTSDPTFKTKELLDNHRCHPSIQDYSSKLLGKKVEQPRQDRRVFWKKIIGDESTACLWIERILDTAKVRFDVRDNAQIGILGRSGSTLARVAGSLSVPTQYHVTMPIEELNAQCAGFCTEVLRIWQGDITRTPDLLDQLFSRDTSLGRWQADRFLRELRATGQLFKAGDRAAALAFLAHACDKLRISGWDDEFEEDLRKTLAHDLLQQAFAPVHPDKIQLYTLHKSKGLEFDIVIHMDLHDYILPSFKSLNAELPQKVRDWEMTQDTNLHYVGLTRARKAVFLVHQTLRHNSENQEKRGVRSRFLSEALQPYAVELRPFSP